MWESPGLSMGVSKSTRRVLCAQAWNPRRIQGFQVHVETLEGHLGNCYLSMDDDT